MIKTLLDPDLTPSQLITNIKALDMSVEVKNLADQLPEQTAHTLDSSHRAEIMKLTNIHTGTLTLHCNKSGNISLKAPDNAPTSEQLYSVPGNSVLFAINAESFSIRLYALKEDHLTRAELVIVRRFCSTATRLETGIRHLSAVSTCQTEAQTSVFSIAPH
jgi:transcription initiation factor IIF auxiliary subunit